MLEGENCRFALPSRNESEKGSAVTGKGGLAAVFQMVSGAALARPKSVSFRSSE